MRNPHFSRGSMGARAPLSFAVALLLGACGSGGGQNPSGSGGSPASGGAPGNASGGSTGASGGNSGATGGSGTGGMSSTGGRGSGGTSGATGGAASGGSPASSGGAPATGGRGNAGAPGSGGAAGGTTGTGGRANGGSSGGGGTTGGTFAVTSPLWTNMPGCAANMSSSCSNLPTVITRSGAGTSPELHWTGAPANTKSFAVVLQDLSGNSTHWVIWNIPASVTTLPANVDRTMAMPAAPAGAQQCGKGTDAATKFGYIGPGAPCNVYEFRVYALDVASFTPTAASCATTTDAASIRTQLNGLGTLLSSAAILGRTNMTCN